MLDNEPFTFSLSQPGWLPSRHDSHVVCTLSDMRAQYADHTTCDRLLPGEDPVVYEVYTIKRPELAGELQCGISIVHPGTVGDEYFMTKGHYHAVLDTAEIYQCLDGQGMMILETPEGDWAAKELRPGTVLFVPPRWAHRSVNTSSTQALITFFVYPGHAGHDYATIESRGFRKLVVEREGHPCLVDNPRWRAVGGR